MTRHLYLHIPFCNHLCSFCDFRRIVSNNEQMMEQFVNLAVQEIIQSSRPKQYTTVYFGGGTPNHLPNNLLKKLLCKIQPFLANHYEWTIECNPELVTKEQVELFSQFGVNRISLGIQTTNNQILKAIRRFHTIEDAQSAVELIQSQKLNLSVDFIYNLPNLQLSDLADSVQFLVKNNIQHVSYYALEIKPNALLKKQNYIINPMKEEEQMLYLQSALSSVGFRRYEISNWSKTKKTRSKHNLAYWQTKPWKGIGYGAHGFEANQLYSYTGTILNWQRQTETVLLDEQILMMGLRLADGLDLKLKRNQRAWQKYRHLILNDVRIQNNHLIAKNLDCLDDLLVKII